MMKSRIIILLGIMLMAACRPSHNELIINENSSLKVFNAPWNGLRDETEFECHADSSVFSFKFIVRDSDITLAEEYSGERCVDNEDRVEIFFSSDKNLDIYYCLETDPLGRTMDYSCKYYRKMDYDWDFTTLKTSGVLTEEGYIVSGRLDIEELADLGIDIFEGFHIGVFRADYHKDQSVNWYSYVDNGASEADFHKNDVFMPARSGKKTPHYISIRNRKELHEWFSYSPERDMVISGHRGGMMSGYPENCIESFEKTLSMMPSFFEIDPRMTKDSVIVLMHDSTIDRTTNGKGRVSDYTYEQLQEFFLKDREGKLTPYKIPTLEECIHWSQGRTILNLDIKDVPLEFMSDFINSLAPANVMYTVHNASQARFLLERDPDAMFSCWCMNMNEFRAYEAAGIPWSQLMAYVGHFMRSEQAELYENLHRNGVMCMISVAPTHDNRLLLENRVEGYRMEMNSGCDVIETDYPYLFVEAMK